MQVNWPQPGMDKDFKSWAGRMLTVLTQAFQRIPEFVPGTMVLWPSAIAVPLGYLECDGTEYPVLQSVGLTKLFGESSPGNFQVPTITGPAGTIVIIKT